MIAQKNRKFFKARRNLRTPLILLQTLHEQPDTPISIITYLLFCEKLSAALISLSININDRISITCLIAWHNRFTNSALLFSDHSALNIRTDDIFLARFLTVCEWNAADAFIRIKKLFKLKVLEMQFMFDKCIYFLCFQYDHPKWFLNKELKDCKDILKQNAKLMLPGRDKKGRRIYLSRMCKCF